MKNKYINNLIDSISELSVDDFKNLQSDNVLDLIDKSREEEFPIYSLLIIISVESNVPENTSLLKQDGWIDESIENLIIRQNEEIDRLKKIKLNTTPNNDKEWRKAYDKSENLIAPKQKIIHRLISSFLDAVFPLVFLLLILFFRDIEYENTTLFNAIKWSWNEPYFSFLDIVTWFEDQLINSVLFNNGPLKGIASLLLLLWLAAEMILPIINNQSLGMLIMGLMYRRTGSADHNIIVYLLIRNIPYIGFALLIVLGIIIKSHYLIIIVSLILVIYWIIDHMFIVICNKSLSDIISKTLIVKVKKV